MKITEILATKHLPLSSTPRLDLELLLAKALNQSRAFLYTQREYQLTPNETQTFQKLYQRRFQGEPLAYIMGTKEFWSLELVVNDKVLIPRPETETIVETILHQLTTPRATIADLGTGSGAIAVALATERPMWQIIATDCSQEALQVARYNATRLKLSNIEFYHGKWCQALPKHPVTAIISNPPYIAQDDPHLHQGEIRFEPPLALEAGDGLRALKTIIMQAKERLVAGGLLVLEHGYNQSEAVQELLQHYGYQDITPYKDLANLPRAIAAKK